jgi:hemimethylated DNA binding protein
MVMQSLVVIERHVLRRYQPFYNVLVNSDDVPFQTTYVAEENIFPQTASNGEACSPVVHPEVSSHACMCLF